MAAASPVDPSKTATYPVVLSDALLGKASKETYTGIRCKLPISLYLTAKTSVSKLATDSVLLVQTTTSPT